MQRLSTEGFGVIKTNDIRELSAEFDLMSRLIDYPTEELAELSADKDSELSEILCQLQAQPLQELQEHYIELFEMNKKMTLYLTFYRFEDSRERGGMLAKLKMLYEMFGVSLPNAELTDFLPAMLEFLSVGDFEDESPERLRDLELLFSVMEDGTYQLLQAFKGIENEPYHDLIQYIRRILRRCVSVEAVEKVAV